MLAQLNTDVEATLLYAFYVNQLQHMMIFINGQIWTVGSDGMLFATGIPQGYANLQELIDLTNISNQAVA